MEIKRLIVERRMRQVSFGVFWESVALSFFVYAMEFKYNGWDTMQETTSVSRLVNDNELREERLCHGNIGWNRWVFKTNRP